MEGSGDVVFSDPSELNAEVTFSEAGDYKLRLLVTDAYAEDDEIFYQLVDYVYVIVLSDLSSTDNALEEVDENDWTLFPNPSADFINIKADLGKSSGFELRVINAVGKTVLMESGKQQRIEKQLSVKTFPPGKYHLEITTRRKRLLKEFIVLP